MATAPRPTAFEDAFKLFKDNVSIADAEAFQSTKLDDVWRMARDIEERQKQRKSLRNLRRIEPLLEALQKYSATIEVVCNGTPYVPWIWAPIKLMLQLASEYGNIFEKLVKAYSQIAEALPHFSRLQESFIQDERVQNILSLVYADILEFHMRAYKFFRKRSWNILFESLWKDFSTRFNSIIDRLERHKTLLDREAWSTDLVEARKWRTVSQEEVELQEKARHDCQFHDSMTWLQNDDSEQEEYLERMLRRRQNGTCEWIENDGRLKDWLGPRDQCSVLWLRGIPGAGKTVLSAYIISKLQEQQTVTTAFYFCDSHISEKDLYGQILRSLTAQILRQHRDFAPYLYENYVSTGSNPSTPKLKNLLGELLSAIPLVRIVIDGLDECQEEDQKHILKELASLVAANQANCHVLISSREVPQITKALQKKPSISLKESQKLVELDIRRFVHESLQELNEDFGQAVMDTIERAVISKAKGMFLWVRLVIISLQDCHSIEELRDATDRLPEGLDRAYGQILRRIKESLGAQNREKAIRILEFMACSCRVMKVFEIQDAIVFRPGHLILDDATKLSKTVIDLCKPLIEEGPRLTLEFVHYSAKQYLLDDASGPFIDIGSATFNTAFSCLSYLPTSRHLLSPTNLDEWPWIAVAKVHHGFHDYADAYWLDHFLQYLRIQRPPHQDFDTNISEALTGILALEKDGSDALHYKNSYTLDAELSNFADQPRIKTLLRKIMGFREEVAEELTFQRTAAEFTDFMRTKDPTILSDIRHGFHLIAESLMITSRANLNGVSRKMIESFKSIYGQSAFICRYGNCPRSSDGFASNTDRLKHETVHGRRFKCADSSCEFYVLGFASKSSLRQHNESYHSPSEWQPPQLTLPVRVEHHQETASISSHDLISSGESDPDEVSENPQVYSTSIWWPYLDAGTLTPRFSTGTPVRVNATRNIRCVCGRKTYHAPPSGIDEIEIEGLDSEPLIPVTVVSNTKHAETISCQWCSRRQHSGCVGIVLPLPPTVKYSCHVCRPSCHSVFKAPNGSFYSHFERSNLWPLHLLPSKSLAAKPIVEQFVAELVRLFSVKNCASVLRTKYSKSALHVIFKFRFTSSKLADEACERLNGHVFSCITSHRLELLLVRSKTAENTLVFGVNLSGKPEKGDEADEDEEWLQKQFEATQKSGKEEGDSPRASRKRKNRPEPMEDRHSGVKRHRLDEVCRDIICEICDPVLN